MKDKTMELYKKFSDLTDEYIAEEIDVEKLRSLINVLLDSAS